MVFLYSMCVRSFAFVLSDCAFVRANKLDMAVFFVEKRLLILTSDVNDKDELGA